MATRNGAKWIVEQVESILAQRDVQVKIIVQDDCSSDSTLDILREKYPALIPHQIELRSNDSPTGSAGANFKKLFREADAGGFEFVAFADQDDIWNPDKLNRAVAVLTAQEADGYSAAVKAFWADGREHVLAQSGREREADFLFEGAGQGCTFVLTARAFARVQEFCRRRSDAADGFHYHDWLVYLLVRAWGGRWSFDAVPCLLYRQHQNNEIGARGNFGAITRRLSLLSNGWYRKQLLSAISVYHSVGGRNAQVGRLERLTSRRDSIMKRLSLTHFVLRHGRRRLIDRFALAWASMAGWI